MRREQFVKKTRLNAPADDVFNWHEQPGAFERLTPPWESVSVMNRSGGIRDGDIVEIRTGAGLLSARWLIEHRDYVAGRQFRDHQQRGPFAYWDHLHRIEPVGDSACTLEDRITYALPLGAAGDLLAGSMIRRKLAHMFAYRHRVTANDIRLQRQFGGRIMNVAITGASGLVGTALHSLLSTGGHSVRGLQRSDRTSGEGDYWNPTAVVSDPAWLAGCDAVVHLAGENIAGRWTPAKKERIRQSRVRGTKVLCESLANSANKPNVLVCASAVGFYGDRGDEALTEDSQSGSGFLPDVCHQWEEAAQPAVDAGIRVVHLRYGVVLSAAGGALAKMLTPFKLGAGGPIGSGQQYMSWIAIDDAAGLIAFALANDNVTGPINAVAPNPVTNRAFSKTLGSVLHRPAIAPMPAFAARLAFGEMADALLLASAKVIPQRATDLGYEFQFPQLEAALRHVLGH